MNKVAIKKGKNELVSHGSWGHSNLGEFSWEMHLYISDNGSTGLIEWDCGDAGFESIGLVFDGTDKKELIDYDGIMSMPEEAFKLLEEQGYIVEDMRV